MKSKKFIIGLILLSLMFSTLITDNTTSYKPKTQANGDYSLGFKIGDEYKFTCTVFNTSELYNVLGGNWQADIGDYIWWNDLAPADLGDKAKFEIVNITDHPSFEDWWAFTIDGWNWINKSAEFNITPDQDDIIYSFPKNITVEMWNPSVWIISKPVVLCLSELSFGTNYTINENLLIYTGFDVDYFFINWLYDKNTGVVKSFKIRNGDDAIIFELSASASSEGGIPGYSLYILISTLILLISFISIILIKKVKWK